MPFVSASPGLSLAILMMKRKKGGSLEGPGIHQPHDLQGVILWLWGGLWDAFSQTLGHLLSGPPHEVHLAPFPSDGCVLVSLELAVVIGEFVVEDGDWHPVEDDPESDAEEGKEPAQVGLRVHVSVAHSGDAHLRTEGGLNC